MKKILVYFLSIFLISLNSHAIPVGGITKFKSLFSKGDEMIDAGSTVANPLMKRPIHHRIQQIY